MNLSDAVRVATSFASDNSSAILTGVGVTGTVTTAYLTGRASFKAAGLIIEENQRLLSDATRESLFRSREEPDYIAVNHMARPPTLSRKEQISLAWPLYLPAVGVGVATITSIVMANRLSSKQAAALAAAYGISERALQEYKEKVVEKLGERREQRLRDEIAQDRVNKTRDTQAVIVVGDGKILCYDQFSGQYFQSTIETIKRAVNAVNEEINNHMFASLSMFYDELELRPTTMSDSLGWNATTELIDVEYSYTSTDDGRPCLAIDFRSPPRPDYARHW